MLSSLYDTVLDDVDAADALVVFGRGLGAPMFLGRYARRALRRAQRELDPNAIVLILHVQPALFSLLWRDAGLCDGDDVGGADADARGRLHPRQINNEFSVADRRAAYDKGGLIVATSRILTHDFLRGVVPSERVAGIVVNDAHRLQDESVEAFVLRLYRRENRTGFIKAFTDDAEALTRGFHRTEKLMRLCFVSQLHLWPRFHELVQDTLDARPAEVIELSQPLSLSLSTLQRCVLDAFQGVLDDLHRSAASASNGGAGAQLDLGDVRGEDSLYRSLYDAVRRQLEPQWHRVNARTRQLVQDLRTLKSVQYALTRVDCVQFLRMMNDLKEAETARSSWLLSPAAETLFALAKKRVYSTGHGAGGSAAAAVADGSDGEEAEDADALWVYPNLEENPKWSLLMNVLEEIQRDANAKPLQDVKDVRIVIFVRDEMMQTQLENVMRLGASNFLSTQLELYLRQRSTRLYRAAMHTSAASAAAASSRRSSSPEPLPTVFQTTLTQLYTSAADGGGGGGDAVAPGRPRKRPRFVIRRAANGNGAVEGVGDSAVDAELKRVKAPRRAEEADDDGDDVHSEAQPLLRAERGLLPEKVPQTLVVAMSSVPGAVKHFLDDARPNFIVLYEPDIDTVREMELYKADHPHMPLRVYFLAYEDTMEEKRYIHRVQGEYNAFEALIRERRTMIVHADQEGRRHDVADDELPPSGEAGGGGDGGGGGRALIDTRRMAAARDDAEAAARRNTPSIVVDVRELRSGLCSILHRRGVTLLPVTLSVGDYILSPSVCVERKSLADLVSSFHSGRLFTQVEHMLRHYDISCVLLEFDAERALSLTNPSELERTLSVSSTYVKLVILLRQFPMLRLLWCSGAHETAELFAELKRSEAQPDEATAVAVGGGGSGAERDELLLLSRDENFVPTATPVAATGAAAADAANAPSAFADVYLPALQLLRSLPGVNAKNLRRVVTKVRSVRALLNMSLEDMGELLGTASARQLHAFANALASAYELPDE